MDRREPPLPATTPRPAPSSSLKFLCENNYPSVMKYKRSRRAL
jgi:hypothetical protein